MALFDSLKGKPLPFECREVILDIEKSDDKKEIDDKTLRLAKLRNQKK